MMKLSRHSPNLIATMAFALQKFRFSVAYYDQRFLLKTPELSSREIELVGLLSFAVSFQFSELAHWIEETG